MKLHLIAIITLISSCLFAEEVILKIATVTPEGSLWTKKLRDMDKEIKKKTKGRVRLKIYADSRKGSEAKVVRKINDFKLDGALFLQSGMENIVPQTSILQLPYYYKGNEHWQKVQATLKKDLEFSFSKKQIKVLGWVGSGFTYAFTNKQVQSLKNFQQLKNWLYTEDPLIQTCFERLGLKGKEIKVKEVLQSLQKKDINSVYASPYLLVALEWHKHVNYCIDLPINNVVGGFVLHEKAYASIPSKMRKKVGKIIKKHMKLLSKTIHKENAVAKELLKKKYKIQFVQPDNNWANTCQKLGQKIAEENVGKRYTQQQLQTTK
ncbi:TRAP transporter substrate-binding protein DctP [Candidatus Uabimicrobium sp. HlEnr_7]|uniref:TRAP transporter substrate-binding protein DctP n=1 Tax=Candidatus Uabimicrobium helgolandensis TaxID=3095367 RepID=UPI00355627B6